MRFLVPVMVLILGCGYDVSVNGLYQADKPIDFGDTQVYISMTLAQYGPDVGGLVHLYSDPNFLEALEKGCNCLPISNGEVSDGRFRFSFDLPANCIPKNSTGKISFIGLDLTLHVGHMDGRILIKGGKPACPGNKCDLIFTRVKKLQDLTLEDKQCQD